MNKPQTPGHSGHCIHFQLILSVRSKYFRISPILLPFCTIPPPPSQPHPHSHPPSHLLTLTLTLPLTLSFSPSPCLSRSLSPSPSPSHPHPSSHVHPLSSPHLPLHTLTFSLLPSSHSSFLSHSPSPSDIRERNLLHPCFDNCIHIFCFQVKRET